jgi:hypothetical protein
MNLSFYDPSRMGYTASVAEPRDGAAAEWMVGAYREGGGCEEGGEFALQLVRFGGVSGVRVCAFTDALGSLRALIDSGALDVIEKLGTNVRPVDVAGALVGAGVPDRSRVPLGGEPPVGRPRP